MWDKMEGIEDGDPIHEELTGEAKREYDEKL